MKIVVALMKTNVSGPSWCHTKPTDGIFHVYELDSDWKLPSAIEGKVYSYKDFAHDSISFTDKSSYLSLGANKYLQRCCHNGKNLACK